MGRTNLYIPEEKLEMFERFKKATKLRRTSVSAVFVKAMETWMIGNDPDNPQTSIVSFGEEGSITMAQVEEQVKQYFYHRDYPKYTTYKEVVRRVKELQIEGRERVAMSRRIMEWLKGQGKKGTW